MKEKKTRKLISALRLKRCLSFVLVFTMLITALPIDNSIVYAQENEPSQQAYISIEPKNQEVEYGQNANLSYSLSDLFTIDGIDITDLTYGSGYEVSVVEDATTVTYENSNYNSSTYRYMFTPTSSGVLAIKLMIFEDVANGIPETESIVTCTIKKGDINTQGYYFTFNGGTSVQYGTDNVEAIVYKMDGTPFATTNIVVDEEQDEDASVVFSFAGEGERDYVTAFPKEAGTYSVKASVKTSALWNEFAVYGTMIIKPKPINISVTTSEDSYEYASEEIANVEYDYDDFSAELEYEDTVESLGLSFTTDATDTSVPEYYKIYAAATDKNYSVKVNYDETDYTTGYLKIEPKPVTIAWPEGEYEFTYDVINNVAVEYCVDNAEIQGVVAGDDVEAVFENNKAYLPGTYTANVIGLTGEHAECYVIGNQDPATLSKEWVINYAPVSEEDVIDARIDGTTFPYERVDGVKWYGGDVSLVASSGLEISLNVREGWNDRISLSLAAGKNTVKYYLRMADSKIIVAEKTVDIWYDNTSPDGELTYRNVTFDRLIDSKNYSNKFFANTKSAVNYVGVEDAGETVSGLASIEYKIINNTNPQVQGMGNVNDNDGWQYLYIAEDVKYVYDTGYDRYEVVQNAGGLAESSYNFIPCTLDAYEEFSDNKPNYPNRPNIHDYNYPNRNAYRNDEEFEIAEQEWIESEDYENYIEAIENYEAEVARLDGEYYANYYPNAAVGENVIMMRFTDWAGNVKEISSDNIIVFDEFFTTNEIYNDVGEQDVDFVKAKDSQATFEFEDLWDSKGLYLPFKYSDRYVSKLSIKGTSGGIEEADYRDLVVGTDYAYNGNYITIYSSALRSYDTLTTCSLKLDYKPFGYTIPDYYQAGAQANDKPVAKELKINIVKEPGWIIVNNVKGSNVEYSKVYDGKVYGDFTCQKPKDMTVKTYYAPYSWTDSQGDNTDFGEIIDEQEWTEGMPTDAGKYIAKFELIPNETVNGCITYKKFEIKKRPVTATLVSGDKTYDNTVVADITDVNVDTGLDDKNLYINPEAIYAEYNDANVGLGKTVTYVSLKENVDKVIDKAVDDKSDIYENYAVTYKKCTSAINAKEVTITLPDITSTYGENHSEAFYEEQQDGTDKLVYENADGTPVTGVEITGLLDGHDYQTLDISNYSTVATSKSNVIKEGGVLKGYPVSAKVGNKNYKVTFNAQIIIEPKVAEFEWNYVPAGEGVTNATEYLFTTRYYRVTANVSNVINGNEFELGYNTYTKQEEPEDDVFLEDRNRAKAIGEYRTTVAALGNDNYTLEGSTTADCEWEIQPYETDAEAIASELDGNDNGDESINGWYRLKDEVIINAPDGYTICLHEVDGLTGDVIYDWDSEIVDIELVNGINTIQYHLRNISTGYVTAEKEIKLAVDRTAPLGQFKLEEGNWFTNREERFNFSLFFKGQTYIEAEWTEEHSGIDKVEYALLDAGDDVNSVTVNWKDYGTTQNTEHILTLEEYDSNAATGFDKFIYMKFTDKAGNVSIVNSDGVVVYTDSVYYDSQDEGYNYTKLSLSDVEIDFISGESSSNKGIILNDNTVESIEITDSNKENPVSLNEGTDYTVKADKITIDGAILDKLEATHYGRENNTTYYFKVTVNPRGRELPGGVGLDDTPEVMYIPLHVHKATTTISALNYHKVYDGKNAVNSAYSTHSDGVVSANYYVWDAEIGEYVLYPSIPKNAGTYYAEYYVEESDLYYETEPSGKVEVVIEKRPVNVYIQVATKVFDGNTSATIPAGAEGVSIDTGIDGEAFVYEGGLTASFETYLVGRGKKVICGDDEYIADNIRFGAGTTADINNYTMKFIVNPAEITKRPVCLVLNHVSAEYGNYISTGSIQYADVSSQVYTPEEMLNAGLVSYGYISVYYEGGRREVQADPYDVPVEQFSVESDEYVIRLMQYNDEWTSENGEPKYIDATTIPLYVYEKSLDAVWNATTTDKSGNDVVTRLFYGRPSLVDHAVPYNAKDYNVTLDRMYYIMMDDIVEYEAVESEDYTYTESAAVVPDYYGEYAIKSQLKPAAAGNDNKNYTIDFPLENWSIYYADDYYKDARDSYSFGSVDYRYYDELYHKAIDTNANGSAWVNWYNSDVEITPEADGYKISEQNTSCDEQYWKDYLRFTEEGVNNTEYALMDNNGYISSMLSKAVRIDKTAPAGSITLKATEDNKWSFDKFLETITFGMFVADKDVEVIIDAGDVIPDGLDEENVSKIKDVEYQIVDSNASYDDENWIAMDSEDVTGAALDVLETESGDVAVEKSYATDITIDNKAVVYAKITDYAGNSTIINSNGIVVYSNDAINAEKDGYEFKDKFERFRLEENSTVVNYITTNNYPIASVTSNGQKLVANKDYTIADTADANVKKLTLKSDYISALKANTYTVIVKYKPLEEEFIAGTSQGDEPVKTSFQVVVKRQRGEVILDDEYATANSYTGDYVAYPTIKFTKSSGAPTYEFKKVGEEDSAFSEIRPKDAGNYEVRVTIAYDDNYEEAYARMAFEIDRKEVEVKVPVKDKEYDGNVNATVNTLASLDYQTGIENEELVITGYPVCEFINASAGDNKAIKVISSDNVSVVSGNANTKVNNYKFTFVADNAKITKKPIVIIPNNVSRYYGDVNPQCGYSISNETPLVSGTAIGDVVLKSDASIYSGIGYYDIELDEEASDINSNYRVSVSGEDKLYVSKRPVSVIWPAGNVKTYNAKEQVYTAEVGNVVAGDGSALSFVYSDNEGYAYKATSVGTYNAKVISLTGTGSENYMIDAQAVMSKEWSIDYSSVPEDEDAEVNLTDASGNELDPDKWYNSPVTLKAPDGYYISENGGNADSGWTDSIRIDSESDDLAGTIVTYYLKNADTGAITDSKTVTVKIDKSVPTGHIEVKNRTFASIINKITFGLFCKDTAAVDIIANDDISGIAKVEYMLADSYETYVINRNNQNAWTVFEDLDDTSFSMEPAKAAVFARITDKAGNYIEFNTDGIVVYENAQVDTSEELTYVKTSKTDIAINADLKDNEIKSIVIGKETLEAGDDYIVVDNTQTGGKKIVLMGEYLDKLAAKDDPYNVVISYSPQGVMYAEGVSEGDAPVSTTLLLNVKKKAQAANDLVVNIGSADYNGAQVQPEITTDSTGRKSVYYKKAEAGDDTYTTVAPKDAGNYIVKVEIAEDDNYKALVATQPFTIRTKDVTVDVPVTSATYGDAVPEFVGVVNASTPMAAGEDYNDLKMSFKAVKDGSVITGITETGTYNVIGESANANYNVTVNGTGSYVINPRSLIIHWTEGVYLYTAKEQFVEPIIKNCVPGDECNMTVIEDRKTAAGVYTAVVTDIDNDNYTLEGATSITWNWSISYNEDDVNISINDEAPSYDWYKDDIVIQAPEGYMISQQNTDADNGWTQDITITEEAQQDVIYYLKKISDGSITDAKVWTAKIDRTKPTGTISVKGNTFKEVVNTITFGLFFKNTADVVIEANDETSKIAKIEYQVTDGSAPADNAWEDYSRFSINANSKAVVYARITDNAGYETIINTNGVIVYTDAIGKTDNISFTKTSTEDVTASVILNGNTIKAVKNGNNTLTADNYTLKDGVITFKADYLNTLSAGNHVIEVMYNPFGYDMGTTGSGEAPNSTFINLKVEKKVLPAGEGAAIAEISDEMKYNGTAVAPQITTDSTGKMTVMYKTAGAEDDTYTTDAPKNIGDYVVRVVIEADENYEEIVVEKEFTIEPIVAELEWSNNSLVYNEKKQSVTATVKNAVAGDNFVIAYQDNEKTEVGNYTAKVTALGNENYTLTGATGVTYNWSINFDADNKAENIVIGAGSNPSESGWYNEKVVIKAPEGYVIKTDNMSNWADSVEITEDGDHKLTIYVKNILTGAVSQLSDVAVKLDSTAPDAKVTVLDKEFNSSNEPADTAYTIFKKEDIAGNIVGTDLMDKNVTVEYQKVSSPDMYDPNGNWVSEEDFTIGVNEKSIVYAKITDAAGNVTVVNSSGIIVYKDAEQGTAGITYTKESGVDVTASVILNANTIANIMNGTQTLTKDVHYTVDVNGVITFKNAYLNSLAAGDYTFTVSYNPLGITYVEAEGNEAPATTTIALKVAAKPVQPDTGNNTPIVQDQEYIQNVIQNPTVVEQNTLTLNEGLKVDQKGSQIKVKWGKVTGADGYQVYIQYCGKKFTKTPTVTNEVATKTSATVSKINGKKLNLKKNFKIYIEAYKLVNGKKIVVGETVVAHIVGRKNTKYTNVKAVKVQQTKCTLTVGKSAKIKARTVLVEKKKKQLTNAHAKEFRYASSDRSIAVVNAQGTITAKKAGTCTVYVYARNGYTKKVKVTVK